MSEADRAVERLLPLTPAFFHVLLSIADVPRHGYGIMQEVADRTGGKVQLGPGTLYGAIRRLREERLIEEQEGDAADQRRRVYRLTRLGRTVAAAEATRLAGLVESARSKSVLPQAGGA